MTKSSDFFDLKVERNDFEALLEDRRKEKEFTDVQLQIGDKLFDAHRVVLSLYSPVLRTMISEKWSTTKICPISEEYVDVDIVEDLVSFLYTGSIKLTPDNVHSICVAAHFLQIPTLLEPSVKYLFQFINFENVLTLSESSTLPGLEDLNYSCLRFVTNNHQKVFLNSGFLEFSFENFKALILGLKKFWTKMLREHTFDFIVRWTEKNLSKRLDHLPILLKSFQLEELPLKHLTETVSNHPLVKDSIFAMKAVSTALANYQTYSNLELQANQNMIVIGGYKKDDGYQRSMSCYDFRSGVWRKLPDMPSYRCDFGVSVVDQQNIIVCGGSSQAPPAQEITRSVIMFDWSKQTWLTLTEMPVACLFFSVAVHNGYLYVVGVYSKDERADESKVARYSFETKQWEYVASINRKRSSGALIAHKNHLYALGGESYNPPTIEKYDPVRNEWTKMAEMKSLNSLATTVHQDKIYVYGTHGIEVYDPETNILTSLPEPPVHSKSLVSLNGKLLAVGGYLRPYTDIISDSIYEFNFITEKWIEFGKMNSKLIHHTTVAGAFY